MKKIKCCLVCVDGKLDLHVGYEVHVLPKVASLVQTFNVSDVFIHFDSLHFNSSDLL